MTAEPLHFSFRIADFDLTQLPVDGELLRSDPLLLTSAVSDYLASQFKAIGGEARITVANGTVDVSWVPASGLENLISYGIEALKNRNYDIGVPLLKSALPRDSNNELILFNLGMALSDQGHLNDAIALLGRLVELHPRHAHAWTALGVAHARNQDIDAAVQSLYRSIEIDPDDGYSHKNLGGLLGKTSPEKALSHLERAAMLLPDDQAAQYGYGLALCKADQFEAADPVLIRAIDLAPLTEIAELARTSRTQIAQKNLRGTGGVGPRMDVVMYCLSALQFFDQSPAKVQPVAFEIAMLGRSGLDINNPEQKYSLKSMPGNFSGLHLLSFMYVGFKKLDPGLDAGIDFANEYAHALQLFDKPE